VLTNPEPVTVRVWAFEPAGTLVGLMDETAGVGVVFPPPPPEPLDPDPEPPLPQPLTITAIESPKTKAEMRTETSDNLQNAVSLTERLLYSVQRVDLSREYQTIHESTLLLRPLWEGIFRFLVTRYELDEVTSIGQVGIPRADK
jgi:hypothetical protein